MNCPAYSNELETMTVGNLTVDVCKNGCGGILLDAGELRKIRDQFETEADRKQAANEYFDADFGDDRAKLRAEDAQTLKRARHIANMFNYICPSYYIPGKQE